MLPLRPLLWLLLLLVAMAAPAGAVELWITGPEGARVEIDGREVARLPLDAPLQLETGVYRLRCSLAGRHPHEETLEFGRPDDRLDLRLSLLGLSRVRAVGYSALLAGLGQHYEGRPVMGWTMMGLELSAVGVAVWGESRLQSARDDYESAMEDYERALLATDIVRLREEAQSAYDDMESAENLRNAAFLAAGAVVLWSVVDAWLGLDDVEFHAQPALEEMRVGWSLGF